MEGVRLIQCYSCFIWCRHLRSECPSKNDPQICSHCTETGHKYTECPNNPYCINCHESHPATARICPAYLKALEEQKPLIARQLAYLILSNHTTTQNSENAIIKAIKSATLESNTPLEFLALLFQTCKNILTEPSDIQQTSNLNESAIISEPNLNESNNSQPDTMEILNEDESSPIKEATDLEKEIEIDINTVHKPLPKATTLNLMPETKQDDKIPTFLYGLTDNGVEIIKENKSNTDLHICTLLDDEDMKNNAIVYFNTHPGTETIYLEIENSETLEISPYSISKVTLYKSDLYLNIVDLANKYVHLQINKTRVGLSRPNATLAEKLVNWLHKRFSIRIEYDNS